jgi:hypothetical protein
MTIRNVLLCGYFVVWAAVVGVVTWQTRDWPPAEAWSFLAFGATAILAAFKNEHPKDDEDYR